ncbi:hypothetical protein Tcan_01069, partial [Toxocara canis]
NFTIQREGCSYTPSILLMSSLLGCGFCSKYTSNAARWFASRFVLLRRLRDPIPKTPLAKEEPSKVVSTVGRVGVPEQTCMMKRLRKTSLAGAPFATAVSTSVIHCLRSGYNLHMFLNDRFIDSKRETVVCE